MSEHDEQREQDGGETPAEGEEGREEVAGQRGGQPGYDLEEEEVYKEAKGEDQ